MGLLNSEASGKEDENFNFHPWTQDYNDFIDLTSTFSVSILVAVSTEWLFLVLISFVCVTLINKNKNIL